MNRLVDSFLPIALAITFVTVVHGTEVANAVQFVPDDHSCECAKDCACRGPDAGCGCSRPELTMKGRCGCGGSQPEHEGTTPSWDVEFALRCSYVAPLLIQQSPPVPGIPRAWRLAFEHEHPPRTLP